MPGENWIRLKRVDWISILDAAYAKTSDTAVWASQLADAAESAIGQAFGFHVIRYAPDARSAQVIFERTPQSWPTQHTFESIYAGDFEEDRVALYRAFCFEAGLANTARSVEKELLAPQYANCNVAFRKTVGIEDALGLITHPQPGVVGVFYWGTPKPIALGRAERIHFAQLALHLETALRLRFSPRCLLAVVDSRGRVLHREKGAPIERDLRRQVEQIEQARADGAQRDLAGIGLWKALVDGSVSLVTENEGSRRQYMVIENSLQTQPMRALSKGETDAAVLAARGLTNKLAAYALGVSGPAISARLASAAAKLGLAGRTDVVRLTAQLTGLMSSQTTEITLTQSEHEVARLVAAGMSNSEIAAARGRSVRTVANQVAQILRKTGRSGRRGVAGVVSAEG